MAENTKQHADGGNAKSGDKRASDAVASQPAESPESVQEIEPDASQASQHQARWRVMEDIVKTIGKPDDGLTRKDWRQIKERYWVPNFDRTVRGPDDPTTVRELLATPEGETPLIVQLLSGSFETQDPAEQEALLALHTMASFSASSGGSSLPAALADRRHDPNITRGDVIMFEVFSDAFLEMSRNSQISPEVLQEWEELASSPNALVRLLALRTFSKVAPEAQQWLEFYHLYQNESDPLILEEATSLALLTGLPTAAEFLTEVRERFGEKLSPEFSDKLGRSIDFLRSQPAPE